MPENKPLQDVIVPDIPRPVLDAIQIQADRRGWSRLKMIRHILAQAAAAETRRQASKQEEAVA